MLVLRMQRDCGVRKGPQGQAGFLFLSGEIYACLQAERGEGTSGEGVIEDSGEKR